MDGWTVGKGLGTGHLPIARYDNSAGVKWPEAYIQMEPGTPQECTHQRRGRTEGFVVCVGCGQVLENDALVADAIDNEDDKSRRWHDLRQTRRVTAQPSPFASKILHELAHSICARFSLPPTLAEQTIAVVDQAVLQKLTNRGRAGRRALAATLYLLAKHDGRTNSAAPLAITDLALLIGDEPHELFRSLSLMKPLALSVLGTGPSNPHDPLLFAERFLAESILPAFGHVDQKKAIDRTCGLVRLSHSASLAEGRRVRPLAMACLLVAVEAEIFATVKPNDFRSKCRLACAHSGLSVSTVMLRVAELKKTLADLGAQAVPLVDGETIEKTRVAGLLDDILRFGEMHGGAPARPPAFEKSIEMANRRTEQVERAKERLAAREPAVGQLTIEDLVIERLMLHGISVEKIVAATSTKQLFSIEEGLFVSDLSDAD